jgi:hypothetical protein
LGIFDSEGSEDGPEALAAFSEEPDDPRVSLPAHRMGDELPVQSRNCPTRSPVPPRQRCSERQLNISRSSPAVFIAVKKVPIHGAPRGSAARAQRVPEIARR